MAQHERLPEILVVPRVRDVGSVPGSGRSSGGGHGNPCQYSCLENPRGQRSLAGYSPWGFERVRHDLVTLGWEDPLEEGMTTHASILAWRIPLDRGA